MNGHQQRIYINHNELFKDLIAQSQRGRKLSSETLADPREICFGHFWELFRLFSVNLNETMASVERYCPR